MTWSIQGNENGTVQGRGGCGARPAVVRGARLTVWSRRSPEPMIVALDVRSTRDRLVDRMTARRFGPAWEGEPYERGGGTGAVRGGGRAQAHGLVAQAAAGQPREPAPERLGRALGQRGLADPGGNSPILPDTNVPTRRSTTDSIRGAGSAWRSCAAISVVAGACSSFDNRTARWRRSRPGCATPRPPRCR